jgi:hypothetical protein
MNESESSQNPIAEIDDTGDFDRSDTEPAPGSIEQAARRIDQIIVQGGEPGQETEGNTGNGEGDEEPNSQAKNQSTKEAADASMSDLSEPKSIRMEIDGEAHDIPLADLKVAFEKSDALEKDSESLRERRIDIETAFESAASDLGRLIPALKHQLLGDFSGVETPQDLQALAAADPLKFAEYQARQFALAKAEEQAAQLQAFQSHRRHEHETKELAKLVPELTKPESGDTLRADLQAYGIDQGLAEERILDAGAAEIAVLYKAMKYDRLEKGQRAAAARAKRQGRAAKVMTPGAKKVQDPDHGYRNAMATLKKTGRVDDAARVIELML